jgi:hypothetical protein
MTKTGEIRKELGVSLDELSAVLGPGFSRARLSVLERGLRPVSDAEQAVIASAIERIGQIRAQVRSVVRTASSIDLVPLCADIRQRAASL